MKLLAGLGRLKSRLPTKLLNISSPFCYKAFMQNEIFKHSDYRAFLWGHAELKRAEVARWSLGGWSKRLGLNATSSLTKILNGEREPGEKTIKAFTNYFNFSAEEELYFRDLVRLSKIKSDPILKLTLLRSMGTFHPSKLIRVLEDKTFEIISKWHFLSIREIVKLKNFQENPEWIQSRLFFKVSTEEIKKAIEILLHQGLLSRNTKGRLVTGNESLQTKNDRISTAIQSYHTQMLENAKVAIKEQDIALREFTSETICMNKDDIPKAKEFIRKFRAEFTRAFEVDEGDEIYQIQVQLFSLTKDTAHEA